MMYYTFLKVLKTTLNNNLDYTCATSNVNRSVIIRMSDLLNLYYDVHLKTFLTLTKKKKKKKGDILSC